VRRTRGFLLAVVALVALVVPASASSLPPQPGGVYPPPFVFAIWHESTRASEIYTLEPRTGRRTVVVRSGSGALYPAAWRASTGRVYYVQDYSTSGEVMSVPVTGGTPRSEQVVLDRNGFGSEDVTVPADEYAEDISALAVGGSAQHPVLLYVDQRQSGPDPQYAQDASAVLSRTR
jgi:hypothetical protein